MTARVHEGVQKIKTHFSFLEVARSIQGRRRDYATKVPSHSV